MAQAGERSSIVSILCDHGDRYGSSYFNDAWLTENDFAVTSYEARMETLFAEGGLPDR